MTDPGGTPPQLAPTRAESGKPQPTGGNQRRQRPGKRERMAKRQSNAVPGEQSGLPKQPHPVTGKAKEPLAKLFSSAVTGGEPDFQPGKFPVVFDVGAGAPTVDRWFVPNVETMVDNARGIYNAVATTPKFVEFKANLDVSSTDATERFESRFESASLLVAATQLVEAHSALGFPKGDFGVLTSSEINHLYSVYTVSMQYGDFKIPQTGENFRIRGYDDVVKSVIRTADRIWDVTHQDDRDEHLQSWWTPVRRGDEKTRFILCSRLQRSIAKANLGFTPDREWLLANLFKGKQPVWWREYAPIPTGETEHPLDWLWAAEPKTAEAWVALKPEQYNPLDLYWKDPEVEDLSWGFSYKEVVARLASRWASYNTVLNRFFTTEVTQILKGRETGGVPTQIADQKTVEGVLIQRNHVSVNAAYLSLAACFPPKSEVFLETTVNVVTTTLLNVQERGALWAQKDILT